MKLYDLLNVIAAEQKIMIRDVNDMIVFCDTAREAIISLGEEATRKAKVMRVETYLYGIMIETDMDE